MHLKRLLRQAVLCGALLVLGALGGAIIGFVITLYGDYIGRSGSTGGDYPGNWYQSDAWWLARTYGALMGAMLVSAVYLRYFRPLRITGTRLIQQLGVAALVTLVAGLAGATLLVGVGALSGAIAFVLYGRWVSKRLPAPPVGEAMPTD